MLFMFFLSPLFKGKSSQHSLQSQDKTGGPLPPLPVPKTPANPPTSARAPCGMEKEATTALKERDRTHTI